MRNAKRLRYLNKLIEQSNAKRREDAQPSVEKRRTIPEIADRLRELAVEHGIEELTALADETKRRKFTGVRKVIHTPSTPALRKRMKEYKLAHPELNQDEVAAVFNVSGGRVSESMKGFR